MTDLTIRLNVALEGRYTIERQLGEGGMATVYLAEDQKHHRKVALKVLKPELAAVVGAERFLAEIRTTANLQHPHILPLFDSGQADSFLFYVMPYVQGDTLRDKIDREKQLSVTEALEITKKVATALDYAHEHGVVHRDIKPGNILLSERGEPTIADFGIALAVAQAGGGRVTETGLSLGTPHYMSPEQATGDRDVDPRTDIYALGCVLYEMLIGEPPYTGSTAQAILGKIIQGKPISVTDARGTVPPNVDAVIRKALEKLPADRFISAQEFTKALGDSGFRHGEQVAGVTATAGPWRTAAIASAGAAVLLAAGLAWSLSRPEPPMPVTRLSIRVAENRGSSPDISSDGSLMIYRGVDDDGQVMLWARWLDALDAAPITGTDDGSQPAISPDNQQLVFSLGGSIRIVPLQGGVARTLAEGEGQLCCGRWSPDGAWVYYSDTRSGLRRVPASGGPPESITELDTSVGRTVRTTDVLPGGRGVLVAASQAGGVGVQVTDVETGEVKDLTPGVYARYSPTGHLLYLTADGNLMAAPFDLESLELAGAAVPVAGGVMASRVGSGYFAVSRTGTLLYSTFGAESLSVSPVWVRRDGVYREIEPGWRTEPISTWSSLSLSPNADRLAISIQDSDGVFDLWVKRLDAGPLSRLTFGETEINSRASWSEDGESVTFVAGNVAIATKNADGTGPIDIVLESTGRPILEGFYSPDATWLVYREGGANAGAGGIFAVRPDTDAGPVQLVAGDVFSVRSPALSPNGRWLAYQSDQSGREEVYVRPFPNTDSGVWQVSTGGGVNPVWSGSGGELFFRSAEGVVAVQVAEGSSFGWDAQEVLFPAEDYVVGDGHPMYDVSPDDQEFVMLRWSYGDQVGGPELILVQNFFEELKRLVPN